MNASEKNRPYYSASCMERDSFYYQVFRQSMVGLVIADKDLTVFDVNRRSLSVFRCIPAKSRGRLSAVFFGAAGKLPAAWDAGSVRPPKNAPS
jgi:hypothetical protein